MKSKANRNKTRKELLKSWSPDRVYAFLAAEDKGTITKVPGGWMVKNEFMEKLPFKGEALTAYLEYLVLNV